jgi:hypothetical protein
MRKQSLLSILIFFLGVFSSITFAQSPRYKFGVIEGGVYKITETRARQLGFQNLSEVTFYGYPGILPQKLDSTQLSLQEIPSWQSGDALFVFLEGPTQIRINDKSNIAFTHHLYTDTVRYLIGKATQPKRIQSKQGIPGNSSSNQIWYTFKSLKEEKNNLLNSGRSWYSDPIRQGQSLAVNFGASSFVNSPWLFQAKVMAQSTSPATLRVLVGDELLQEVAFNPIPAITYGIKGREETIQKEFSPANNRLNQIRFTFLGTGAGYLDYVTIGIPFSGENLPQGIFSGKKEGTISLTQGFQSWEISDFFSPLAFQGAGLATGKKWVVFSIASTPSLEIFRSATVKKNFSTSAELIIITAPQFMQAANRLKAHKEGLGITTEVITTQEIFDTYGYGNPDVSAMRNFIAANYHAGKKLKNVLILGKGTFDFKNKFKGRPNLIPIYTSRSSLDPLTTYSSDDYLGLINWGQGEWDESKAGDESLQIGVGRVPAINFNEINTWVEKIIAYENPRTEVLPPNLLTFVSDDGDNGIHMRDAEVHAEYISKNHPFFRSEKLYLDQFEQLKSGTRQSSTALREALGKSLDRGTLLVNYIGHGNETTLAAEEIFRVADIENWDIQNQIPLWVTATCEFGRHDSPFIRSAAEELLFSKDRGAIGLLTTGRPVFSSINFQLNQAFIEEVFKTENGLYQNLGRIFQKTKNKSQNGPLNRNFSLLGDPSLKLSLPELGIRINSLLDDQSKNPIDTLSSLDQLELKGEIIDPLSNAFITNFNGKYQLELWDKPQEKKTLGDENQPFEYEEESNLLFKGEGEVRNGKFTAKLIVPKSTSEAIFKLNLRISALDLSNQTYAAGLIHPKFSGLPQREISDREGPAIRIELDGKPQATYTVATKQVNFTAKFEDQSGIYLSSLVPEKTLRIQVNQNPPISLSGFYRAINGDFKSGEASILLSDLEEGENRIEIFAWDNVGNGNNLVFSIEVKGSEKLQILDHSVFPNPSSEKSNFYFKHNRPGENLIATLEVYSLSGQILFSESRRLVKAREAIEDWNWIFFQSKSKYPGKGTYIYNLSLYSESDLTSDSVSGKLVIQ